MQKRVEFKNPKGMKIVGILHYNPKKKLPVIIVSHGFLSTRKSGLIQKLATRLHQDGFAVLRFDYSGGIGESEGNMANVSVAQQIDDLESAIDFMEKNKFTEKGFIGLVGHSLGGAISMEVASRDDRVKSLVMVASPANFHYQHLLKEGFLDFISESMPERIRKTKARLSDVFHFYEDARQYDLLKIASRIKAPTLLIHGDKDVIVPFESSEKVLEKIKGSKDLRIIKGASHGFLIKGVSDKAAEFTINWMKGHLEN